VKAGLEEGLLHHLHEGGVVPRPGPGDIEDEGCLVCLARQRELQAFIVPEDLRGLAILEDRDLKLVLSDVLGKGGSVALGRADDRCREGIDERIVVDPQGFLFRHGLGLGKGLAGPEQARKCQGRDGQQITHDLPPNSKTGRTARPWEGPSPETWSERF
jgi:hypothetical protein